MAKVLITKKTLQDIANSIRSKTGSQATMSPSQMPKEIDNIPSEVIGNYKVPNGIKFTASTLSEIPENLDFSEVTDFKQIFSSCPNLTAIRLIDTSKGTTFENAFYNNPKLVSIAQIDTSKGKNFRYFCAYSSNLTSVPILDLSSMTDDFAMFSDCTKLTEESLNNILYSLINTSITDTRKKTLQSVGLKSSQAATCQTLSNWDALVAAGWSTGY